MKPIPAQFSGPEALKRTVSSVLRATGRIIQRHTSHHRRLQFAHRESRFFPGRPFPPCLLARFAAGLVFPAVFLLPAAPLFSQSAESSGDASHAGILQAFEEVVLSSPVDELVAETPVEEGDFVEKDTVVLRLRDAEQQLELVRTAAVLRKAEFDAAASKALFAKNVVAADKNLEQEVRHEAAKIDAATARIKADERTLRSPISGVVTKRLKDKGESVSRMEKVAEVMAIDRIFVLLNLPEDMRPSLQLSGSAQVFVPSVAEGKGFEGKIDFIDPVVDPGSGLFRVKVLLENPERLLRPGMRAHVRFAGSAGQAASGGKPSDSSNL